jgi:hypothetical protein
MHRTITLKTEPKPCAYLDEYTFEMNNEIITLSGWQMEVIHNILNSHRDIQPSPRMLAILTLHRFHNCGAINSRRIVEWIISEWNMSL